MAKFVDWINQDLQEPARPEHRGGLAFTGDNRSVLVGVHVTDGGAPAELSGSVVAHVVRSADGGTVTFSGLLDGSDVSAVLPEACFAYPGRIAVMLQLVDGTVKTTMCRAVYDVVAGETGTIIDPGSVVPDLSDILAMLDEMEQATDAANAAAEAVPAIIAPTFDTSTAYTVGDYVYYSGALYRFTADHAAGAWTGTDAVSVKLAPDVAELKSAFKSDDSAGFAAVGNVPFVPAWEKNAYIDEDTGEVNPTSSTYSVTEAIRIPNGATAIITTYTTSVRYATYDENGETLNIYLNQFGINIEIPSENGKYFRIQYPSVTDSDLASLTFRFEYADAIARESEVETRVKDTNANGFSNESASASGNPVVLHNASSDAISNISVSDGTEGEVLSLCGKNIFNFQHKSKIGLVSNGVTFGFNMTTQEYTITSTNGATAVAASANNTCVGCLTLDGVAAYHNFHFRMKVDTPVTITPGYAYEPYYDDKIELMLMWVENGNIKLMPIGYEGATIIASAGVEYGIRLRVAAGWKGSTTMRPQVEIGGEGTAFERYFGVDLPLPLSAGSNLFNMPEVARLKSAPNAYVSATFDYLNQTVLVESTGPASNTIVTNNSYDGKVNTKDWLYICKFTPGATPVFVPGVPEELVGLVNLQVSDGTNFVVQNISTEPKIFIAESGKEYGFRIMVYAGAKFKYLFKPVIATGTEMLKQMGTRYPATSIYTNGGATLSVTYNKAKLSDEILSTAQIAKGVAKLTGGKIVNALDKLTEAGSVVCFIDDDTTSPTLVQRFHDIFAAENVVGNYAVEMENVDNYPNDLPEMLLEYERQGFGMLYHCYKQHGDEDRYWESGNAMYDEDLIRTNFYRGLREFKQIGFNSARYWVTPYGVDDQFIQNLAKEADMECLLSCPTSTYAGNSVLSLGSNVKRYNMPRAIMLSDTDNDWQIKTLIDGCASAPGMLVIVTHVNSWAAADVATNTARLTGLIQYAKAAGCKVQNFMTAYQTFKPLLMLNELF